MSHSPMKSDLNESGKIRGKNTRRTASGARRLQGESPSACCAPNHSEETGPIPDCSFYLAVSLSRDATVFSKSEYFVEH